MPKITIRKGTIDEVVSMSRAISEFDNPHDASVYHTRLKGKRHLIAVAEIDNSLAGFKVGYDKFENKSFYTWMGGVLPAYRKMGIARKLARYQEKFAIEEGFESIVLKTRNRHKNMLLFAISSGYQIIAIEEKIQPDENRILLKKNIQTK